MNQIRHRICKGDDGLKRLVIGVIILVVLVTSVSVTYYYLYLEPKTAEIEFAGVTLTVELATTPAAQQQGLSGRGSMGAKRGMLFVFNQQAEWSFWMHGMEFPLDIIWFNASRQVVFVEQDLPPCTSTICPVYTPNSNAMYVLEVNAGFVKSNNVQLGDSFAFI